MFTADEVESFGEQSWEHQTYDAFRDQLFSKDKAFPCVYGVEAMRRSTLRFGFPNSIDFNDMVKLGHDLQSFLKISRSLTPYTSYVAFFNPKIVTFSSISDYEKAFWRVLNALNSIDTKTWPKSIETRVDTPSWEFSFAGEMMFVVCNTPLHRSRLSRYSTGFTITFQPRWVFDKMGAGTAAGESARAEIRRRLEAYDLITPFPRLGAYGDENNREWEQYFLPDENTVTNRSCPMVVANGEKQRGSTAA